ncbi:MAG TPA: hypothetical protein VF618_09270 [Thermoanaerobaculia bacterium]
MKFRLVLLFCASLAVASAASASCSACMPQDRWRPGTCQPTPGFCSGYCCLMDVGSYCEYDPYDRFWGCSEEGFAVPASYFATPLPALTEGSALRLRLGKGIQPAERRCAGASMMVAKVRKS